MNGATVRGIGNFCNFSIDHNATQFNSFAHNSAGDDANGIKMHEVNGESILFYSYNLDQRELIQ